MGLENLKKPSLYFDPGFTIPLKVIKMDPPNKKIVLSINAFFEDKDKTEYDKFLEGLKTPDPADLLEAEDSNISSEEIDKDAMEQSASEVQPGKDAITDEDTATESNIEEEKEQKESGTDEDVVTSEQDEDEKTVTGKETEKDSEEKPETPSAEDETPEEDASDVKSKDETPGEDASDDKPEDETGVETKE